jgi:hypothetical protein
VSHDGGAVHHRIPWPPARASGPVDPRRETHTLTLHHTGEGSLCARDRGDSRPGARAPEEAAALQGLVERSQREALGYRGGLRDAQRRPAALDCKQIARNLKLNSRQPRQGLGDGSSSPDLEGRAWARQTPKRLLAHQARGAAGADQEGAKPEGRRAPRRPEGRGGGRAQAGRAPLGTGNLGPARRAGPGQFRTPRRPGEKSGSDKDRAGNLDAKVRRSHPVVADIAPFGK